MLWKVSRGSTFEVLTTAAVIFGHSLFCFSVIFREDYNIKTVNQQTIHWFQAASMFVSLMTLQIFVDWYSKALMTVDLAQHGGSKFGDRYKESG